MLGDAVVCWRVCVVWANDVRALVLALFWTVGSIGASCFIFPLPPFFYVLDNSPRASAALFRVTASCLVSCSRARSNSLLTRPLAPIGVFTAWSVMFVGFYYPVPPAVFRLVIHHDIMNAFAFSWSAATNVWATAMIAYKAWCVPSHSHMLSPPSG